MTEAQAKDKGYQWASIGTVFKTWDRTKAKELAATLRAQGKQACVITHLGNWEGGARSPATRSTTLRVYAKG